MKINWHFLLVLLITLAACTPAPTPTPAPLVEATPTPPPGLAPVPLPQMFAFRMFDALGGWASTGAGLVRTSDGGENWFSATPPGLPVLEENYTTYFYDPSTAWLIVPSWDFTSGTLYHTTDGGVTWLSASIPFGGAMMQFFDPQNGVALAALGAGAGSEAVALYSTSNGGMEWRRMYINDPTVEGSSNTLPLSGQKAAMAFRLPSEGFIGGSVPVDEYFYLFQTRDEGETWSEVGLPWPDGFLGYFAEVGFISFLNPQEGYLVASLVGDTMEDLLYQTVDGGVTWARLGAGIPRAHSYSILPGPHITCWDPESQALFSTSDGATWQTVIPNVQFGYGLRLLQFVDASTGFALSVDPEAGHASFYTTRDGGSTWTALIP